MSTNWNIAGTLVKKPGPDDTKRIKNALHLSASAEWGTPAWVVAYARSVLGTIDLFAKESL